MSVCECGHKDSGDGGVKRGRAWNPLQLDRGRCEPSDMGTGNVRSSGRAASAPAAEASFPDTHGRKKLLSPGGTS